jgi:hypothetical protein
MDDCPPRGALMDDSPPRVALMDDSPVTVRDEVQNAQSPHVLI